MKRVIYCTVFMLLSMSYAIAQKQVSFTSHKTGSVVTSREITVKGTANQVPEEGHVWVLVQSQEFSGWYPQGNGERMPQENWSCRVFLGASNSDKGKYDIAVVVVNDEVHRQLSSWVKTVEQTREYSTIDFPESIGRNYQEFIVIDRQ